MKDADLKELRKQASDVAALLKTLSHPNRLLIACQLMQGEQSVSEIETRAGVAQPVLSRDLGRLRNAGLVKTRRESKMIYYSLADERLATLVNALCNAFAPAKKRRAATNASRKRAA